MVHSRHQYRPIAGSDRGLVITRFGDKAHLPKRVPNKARTRYASDNNMVPCRGSYSCPSFLYKASL